MSASAIEGKGGHLFLENDSNRVLEQVTGQLLLQDTQVERWRQCVEHRQAFCSTAQICCKHLLVRNKEYVYQQMLPDDIKYSDFTVVDQFLCQFDNPQLGDSLVNTDLRKHIGDKAMYSQTDTHWTAFGAYLTYNDLMTSINATVKEPVRVLALAELPIQQVKHEGDLGIKMHPPRTSTNYLFEAHLGQFQKFSNRVINVGAISLYRNPSAPNHQRVVIFGNSFTNGDLLKLLASTFHDVWFFFCPNVSLDIVAAIRPEIVVIQYLERFLTRIPDDIHGLRIEDYAAMKILVGGYRNKDQPIPKLPAEELPLNLATNAREAMAHLEQLTVERAPGMSQQDFREYVAWMQQHGELTRPIYTLLNAQILTPWQQRIVQMDNS